MTASEVIDALNLAGVRIELEADGPRLRGAVAPPHLVAELKARREEVIKEVERRQASDRDRYGKAPPDQWGLRETRPVLRQEVRERVVDYALRQGGAVREWCMRRLAAYWERDKPTVGYLQSEAGQLYHQELDAAVALEVLCWQRKCETGAALEFLQVLDEVAATKGTV